MLQRSLDVVAVTVAAMVVAMAMAQHGTVVLYHRTELARRTKTPAVVVAVVLVAVVDQH